MMKERIFFVTMMCANAKGSQNATESNRETRDLGSWSRFISFTDKHLADEHH